MCCEGCSNVAHTTCLNLKKQPNEWQCSDCKESKTKKASKPKQTGGKSLRSARSKAVEDQEMKDNKPS
jgi:hypothetical protein